MCTVYGFQDLKLFIYAKTKCSYMWTRTSDKDNGQTRILVSLGATNWESVVFNLAMSPRRGSTSGRNWLTLSRNVPLTLTYLLTARTGCLMHKRNNEWLKMAIYYSGFVNHKHATCVFTRGNLKNYPQFAGISYRNCCVKEEMYTDVRCLKDAVRRKRPEKWRTSNWFLLHADTAAHQPVLVKDIFA